MKIIDIHAHIFPEKIAPKVVKTLQEYYNFPWKCKGTVDDIRRSMKDGGVYKSVIFSTPTRPQQVTNVNDYLFELKNDERFICFGSVHPDYEDCPGEIRRIKKNGLHGFKFHPDFQYFNVDDDSMLKIYDEIGDDYPIIIHAGDEKTDYSSPYRFAHLLELFPTHKFIAAHLGGYSEWDESKKYLVGKNIYFDTSSVFCKLSPDEALKIIRAHGTDKVLFGTDYPAVDHKSEIERFKKLDLTEQEFADIFYNNAKKILKNT